MDRIDEIAKEVHKLICTRCNTRKEQTLVISTVSEGIYAEHILNHLQMELERDKVKK